MVICWWVYCRGGRSNAAICYCAKPLCHPYETEPPNQPPPHSRSFLIIAMPFSVNCKVFIGRRFLPFLVGKLLFNCVCVCADDDMAK